MSLINLIVLYLCAVCKLNAAANEMYDKILNKHRPLLAAHSMLGYFFSNSSHEKWYPRDEERIRSQ